GHRGQVHGTHSIELVQCLAQSHFPPRRRVQARLEHLDRCRGVVRLSARHQHGLAALDFAAPRGRELIARRFELARQPPALLCERTRGVTGGSWSCAAPPTPSPEACATRCAPFALWAGASSCGYFFCHFFQKKKIFKKKQNHT